ncbi:Hsp33 family molecular chaperone HslO [Granulosicoccaceae sp. 1_MG-2023]|nr:Hsp33 family molecular chaperone HslO [Granulosicoccaceae sp. 1_MG-2023]
MQNDPVQQDFRYRFLIESADVRGVVVRLDESWRETLRRADYPPTVAQVLAEAMAAVVLLGANLKFTGKLSLQVKGDGPLSLLVVQVTDQGKVRGMADWREEPPAGADLQTLFGAGQMSITLSGATPGQDYQGYVSLQAGDLAGALTDYFAQSEQLPTQIALSSNAHSAGGFLLQRLPGADEDEGWNRASQLGATLSREELLGLPVETLLHRLFHEETVRLYEPEEVEFACNCSRERVAGMLQGLGEQEARSILAEQGEITVTCEFCRNTEVFDAVDVGGLFAGATPPDSGHAH